MVKAYSYVRFSSKAQESGDSIRRQLKLARDYASKNGLELDEHTYKDHGVSAFKGKNALEGGLGTFIAAIHKGVIKSGDYLLVESLDRVSRQEVLAALGTFSTIINHGIILVTLSDDQRYEREQINKDPYRLFIAIGVMTRANDESAIKSRRVKEAWDDKRAKGLPLTAMGPAWLQLNKATKKWELLPDKVEIVEKVFALALKGHGSPTIAAKLNDEGVPTMSAKPGDEKERYWSFGTVAALLKNRSVIGTYTPKKALDVLPIEGYYPQIIDPTVFHQVNAGFAKRKWVTGKTGTNVANLFSGLMRCECGEKTRMVSGAPPNTYVRCLSAYSNAGCDAARMPYERIEDFMLNWLLNFEGKPLQHVGQVGGDVKAALISTLEDRENQFQRLLDIASKGGPGIAGPELLLKAMDKLQTEIDGLRSQIRTYVEPAPVASTLEASRRLRQRHKKLKAEVGQDNSEELTAIRTEMQANLRALITKMVLVKGLKQAGVHEMRSFVLYGPIVELARSSELADYMGWTDDGGVVLDYSLPKWGINGTRRRTKVKTVTARG